MAAGLGLLKIIPGNMRGISDIVPVDTVRTLLLLFDGWCFAKRPDVCTPPCRWSTTFWWLG